MNATAVANHLNIAESLIAEVQEWAHVLWVRFTSGRPRFVSKKAAVNSEESLEAYTHRVAKAIKSHGCDSFANAWCKHGMHRIYIANDGFAVINSDKTFDLKNVKSGLNKSRLITALLKMDIRCGYQLT